MKKDAVETLSPLVQALVDAPTVCEEARSAGAAWLEAAGTEGDEAAFKALIAELEEDIVPIDDLIGFADSDAGKEVFGAELASTILAHAQEIKAAGATYCDCPACDAGLAILAKKDAFI